MAPADPERRARRRARRKAELYDVAVEMFATRGFDDVTIEEIVAAADVSKGTFFNYFPTKEHVLVEYRRSLFDFIHAHGDGLEGTSARELFRAYFEALASRVTKEGARYQMLFREVVARPHLLALEPERMHGYRRNWIRYLEVGQAAGEVPKNQPLELLADTIRDLWTGTSTSWLFEPRSGSLSEVFFRKLDLLFDLLELAARSERG